MADFECRQLEIPLEFLRWSFAKRNNFSEGSSEPKIDAQVIRVRGAAAPMIFFNLNYLFWFPECSAQYIIIVPTHNHNDEFTL